MYKDNINTRIPAVLMLILCVCAHVYAQVKPTTDAYFVSGIVRDSITMEPLPYASVTVTGGKAAGALTDEKGIFGITADNNASEITANCLGYLKKTVSIRKRGVNIYDILLSPATTELHEVVVHRGKYSKKNNPAVDFAKRLKEAGPATDPRRNPYYNYDRYEKITLAINDFASRDESSWLFKKFPFLWENVDTSEVSGKPILNLSVKEKASEIHFRRQPEPAQKEVVTGQRSTGIDEIADQQNMRVFFEDILRDIDLYDNDINILQNRFVSPLSPIAPDFYKFYLTDTVDVGHERCIVLSFYPHNKAAFGFTGQVFVPVDNPDMPIRKVTMRIPRGINLNFIDNLYISQEYATAADGSRLKLHDDMTIEARIIPGTPGFYARRNVVYSGHNFTAPADESAVFSGLGNSVLADSAATRSEAFWQEARKVHITSGESNVGNLLARMRTVPIYYWGEKFLKIMVNGYISTGKNSKFDIGPMNTTFSHNTIEGWRFRAGGMTTAHLSKRWFFRGYGAYGIHDHRWKYRGEAEYSFHDKTYHSREFPVHSLRLSHMYDLDFLGQHYDATNADNMFLSLKRMDDQQVTYLRSTTLEYTLELANNFSVHASLQHRRQEQGPYMTFVDGHGTVFSHYNEALLRLQLRYAPGEKFYQDRSHRYPINLDAPVISLTQTYAPRGFLGSKYELNKTELSLQKRFWLSAFGYTDIMLRGAHIWSSCAYPDLLIANANLSYIIVPETFALMNPMEFISDSYCSWDFTYWANGAILNYIPLVKKLKLREAFSFRGMWGYLSSRNNPVLNPELFRFPDAARATRMDHGPYMEVAVGLDNILRCLRIDYVWRLNYRHVPYPIDRNGVRIAFHVTF